MTGTKLTALTTNSAPALLAASSAPPIAGPIARLRFILTAPSAIACVRSSGARSSGCSVCHVGEVNVCPVLESFVSASEDLADQDLAAIYELDVPASVASR